MPSPAFAKTSTAPFFIIEFDRAGSGHVAFECNTAQEGRDVLQDMMDTLPNVCAMLCDGGDNGHIIAEIG